MSQPFRDHEHSMREQATRLAEEIRDLDHKIRVARQDLEQHEEILSPFRATIFSVTTITLLVGGLLLGGLFAHKTIPVPTIVEYRPCGPF